MMEKSKLLLVVCFLAIPSPGSSQGLKSKLNRVFQKKSDCNDFCTFACSPCEDNAGFVCSDGRGSAQDRDFCTLVAENSDSTEVTTAPARDNITESLALLPPGTGPCASNPCGSGTCIEKGNSYKCKCMSGRSPNHHCVRCSKIVETSELLNWFGEECEHKAFFCDKAWGFDDVTGCKRCIRGFKNSGKRKNCKVFNCKESPCEGGGTCQLYGCTCPASRSGLLCQKEVNITKFNQCRKNKCVNGGTCVVVMKEELEVIHGAAYPVAFEECVCLPGYSGHTCQRTCKKGSQNCMHGKCVSRMPAGIKRTKTCACKDGWKGTYCDSVCDSGKYGQDCLKECGRCSKPPCDFVTGECQEWKCEDGYTGKRCDQPPAGTTTDFEVFGRYALEGEYQDDFDDRSSSLTQAFVKDNKRYLKLSAASAFRPGRPDVLQQIRASIRSLTQGSVIVEFTLEIPNELDIGSKPVTTLTAGLRKNAATFKTSVGQYSVNTSSFKIQPVSASPEEDSLQISKTNHVLVYIVLAIILAVALAFSTLVCFTECVCKRKKKRQPITYPQRGSGSTRSRGSGLARSEQSSK